jgi:hypothetical protein
MDHDPLILENFKVSSFIVQVIAKQFNNLLKKKGKKF